MGDNCLQGIMVTETPIKWKTDDEWTIFYIEGASKDIALCRIKYLNPHDLEIMLDALKKAYQSGYHNCSVYLMNKGE